MKYSPTGITKLNLQEVMMEATRHHSHVDGFQPAEANLNLILEFHLDCTMEIHR